MPARVDLKKLLHVVSDRVKCVDFHPIETWILSALYNGNVTVHDYTTQSIVKNIEVSTSPIRCAKFVARKQWIVCGGDDMCIVVFNYNTLQKLKTIDAHSDYVRYLAVHPTLPLLLSSSDDMTVKVWDWDHNWSLLQSFEEHSHYVMMCQWNPKDPNLFASASLDRTIKFWSVSRTASATNQTVTACNFSLTGHKRGINCLEYCRSLERPYLVSGSDDHTVRVWDYHTKQCLQILSEHNNNVSCVLFHPQLPLILSGAEDGKLCLWHSTTYKVHMIMDFRMERLWSLAVLPSSNAIAMGFDAGTMVSSLRNETPVASMHGGKIVRAKGAEIQFTNLKLVSESSIVDGEAIDLIFKDSGSCEVVPHNIAHHPNGRFISVCGDNEYFIYTAQALRSKQWGRAWDFVWSHEGHYALQMIDGTIVIYHNFSSERNLIPSFPVESIYGGRLIGVKSSSFICFYDWDESRLIRQIDVCPKYVWWSENGDYVALACSDACYILKHDKNAVTASIVAESADTATGIPIAFELAHELKEVIETGLWISDCFLYVSNHARLQTFCMGQNDTLAYLERQFYLLGYLVEQNRVYLCDTDMNIISYQFHISYITYQSAICRKEFAKAEELLQTIPENLHTKVAKFLEAQDLKPMALEVTKDPDHKFELALSLGHLKQCREIIKELPQSPKAAVMARWKQLGDAALERGLFKLAIEAFEIANDLNELFLIYSSAGHASKIREVAIRAQSAKKYNLSFLCYFLLRDIDACIKVLLVSEKYTEAAIFARTYAPSQMSIVVKQWNASRKADQNLDVLANPVDHPDHFPDYPQALEIEKLLRNQYEKGALDMGQNESETSLLDLDLMQEFKDPKADAVLQLLSMQPNSALCTTPQSEEMEPDSPKLE